MLDIFRVDSVEFLPIFWEFEPYATWKIVCQERGFVTLVAGSDDELVGYAVAESHPSVLHIVNLEGDAKTSHRLLEILVKMAGERNMSGWCPIDRLAVQRMFRQVGFVRRGKEDFQGRPAYLYCWDRNEASQA
jgi:hypothetical protein